METFLCFGFKHVSSHLSNTQNAHSEVSLKSLLLRVLFWLMVPLALFQNELVRWFSAGEGLVLAVVLFGTKHPLALKLINACRRWRVKTCHTV